MKFLYYKESTSKRADYENLHVEIFTPKISGGGYYFRTKVRILKLFLCDYISN